MDSKIIELNRQRIKVRASELINQIHKEDSSILKQCRFIKDGKIINSKDINFKESCIFIIDLTKDLLGAIGYLGLLKLDDIRIPDTTSNGQFSTIRTSFMTVNSPDIRFSKIEINEGYGYEGIDMPESYKPINFMKKDLILWRLELDVGIGDNWKMYRLCNQWIRDREATRKLNWLFFSGSEEQFLQTYGNDLNLPVYHVELSESIPKVKTMSSVNLFQKESTTEAKKKLKGDVKAPGYSA